MALYPLHNPGAPLSLRLGALELTAFSISAVATYVLVPAFDACFDLGHCAVEAARLRHVFLSHVHQDHAGGAYRHHALRRMYGARPSRVYVPTESRARMVAHLRGWEALEEREGSDFEGDVLGVAPGDAVRLSGRYTVRAFDVTHRIASRGFTVIERRSKLRAAYAGLSGAEIYAARLRGDVVADVADVPVFTYVGDSTIETLRRHPEVGQSEVLFFEATHVGETGLEVSAKYGHTHLDELVALARERPETLANPHVVLKHFSTRYTARDIRRAIDALPLDLSRRVTVLLSG